MKITSEDEEIVRELTDYLSSDESKGLGNRFLEAVKNCLPELVRTNIAQAKVYAQLKNPETAADRMNSARQHLDSFKVYETDPDRRKPLEEYFAAATEFIANQQGKAVDLAILPADDSLLPLYPFFQLQIDTDPKYASLTLPEAVERVEAHLANRTAEPSTTADSYIEEFFQSAMMRARFFEAAEFQFTEPDPAKDIIRVTTKRTKKIDYPVDKVNLKFWTELAAACAMSTSVSKKIRTDSNDDDKPTTVTVKPAHVEVALDLDLNNLPPELKIYKHINQYDKRIYLAAAELYTAGNEIFSLTQIYKAAGFPGNPRSSDLEKIEASLMKMTTALLTVNTKEEKLNYPEYHYFGALLPLEGVTAIINGQLTDGAIHLLREPPLTDFAHGRKQITSVGKEVLAPPMNATEENLSIQDYMIYRISRAKTGSAPKKIRFDAIFKYCKIETAKQKQRAKPKIRTLLDHYKKCNFIADYEEAADGVIITV